MEVCRAECDGVILCSDQAVCRFWKTAYDCLRKNCQELDDRKERITEYWAKRSESFMEQRRRELKSPLAERWLQEICQRLPKGKKLKILDVGCGSGFFSILLAKQGHEVTGTDLTPEMIVNSKQLAEERKGLLPVFWHGCGEAGI